MRIARVEAYPVWGGSRNYLFLAVGAADFSVQATQRYDLI